MSNTPKTNVREVPPVTVSVQLNSDGRIIGWDYAEEGYKLPRKELRRFSDCSGNLYRIEEDTLVFDDSLDIIEVEQSVTTEEVLASLIFELVDKGVL